MKFAKISGKMSVIILAAACLLAVPALSMPMGNEHCRFGDEGMCALKYNLTPEEMNNMTLGELKEMQKQAMNCTSSCPFNGTGRNMTENYKKSAPCGTGNCQMKDGSMGKSDMRDGFMNGMDGRNMRKGSNSDSPMGAASGCNEARSGRANSSNNGIQCENAPHERMTAFPVLLLMDNLKAEDLNNMTRNEIKSLVQEKIQALDNMTLFEITQLEKKKIQEMDNMTIQQLKEDRRNLRQISRILDWANSRHQITMV
jgi:hypothetical protein